MVEFTTRLADGWQRAIQHLALAAVPVALALLEADKLASVASFDGAHVGLKFGLPVSVVTVWQFVSLPNDGVAVSTGVPLEMVPFAVVIVPVVLVVRAALAAGYFGSLRNALAGEPYAFAAAVRRHFWPFLVLQVLPLLVMLPLALGVFGLGAGDVGGGAVVLFVLAFPLYLLLAYLFYATPYLVVLRDVGLLEAVKGSYALAVEGGPYLAYAAGFALFVLVVSPVVTAIVVNLPVLGLGVGVLGGGVLGLAANAATMRFVADLDPESSLPIDWDEPSAGDGGAHAVADDTAS